MKPATHEYLGRMLTKKQLSKMTACEVSLRVLTRRLREGKSASEAILRITDKELSKINAEKASCKGRRYGSENKPNTGRSELPKYSKAEALAIMLIPVNPKKSRYHNFGVMNNPLDAIRRRSRIR